MGGCHVGLPGFDEHCEAPGYPYKPAKTRLLGHQLKAPRLGSEQLGSLILHTDGEGRERSSTRSLCSTRLGLLDCLTCLIIPLIIQTIRLAPSSAATDPGPTSQPLGLDSWTAVPAPHHDPHGDRVANRPGSTRPPPTPPSSLGRHCAACVSPQRE